MTFEEMISTYEKKDVAIAMFWASLSCFGLMSLLVISLTLFYTAFIFYQDQVIWLITELFLVFVQLLTIVAVVGIIYFSVRLFKRILSERRQDAESIC